MRISDAVAERILQLCAERKMTVNKLCTVSAVTQSTVNDIVNRKAKNVGVVTLKKLCDGLGISVVEFFDSDLFRDLEQEIV
ncbi:MAG: helix-turn-helix transcriptional regulator [Oscillospiraceae bacterium]|nr:helix-turn-helix transcriptional regulator [Oscillospiraceae bacterium]